MDGEDPAADSTSIMVTHQIDFMRKDVYVVTELQCRQNIKFMRAKTEMLDCLPELRLHPPLLSSEMKPLDLSHRFHRLFHQQLRHAASPVTTSSSASSLISQTQIVPSAEDPGYYGHAAVFAAGRVLPDDIFDGWIFESFRSPRLIDIVKLLCGREYKKWHDINSHLSVQSSVLTAFEIPKRFVGLAYKHLVQHWISTHQMVPVAIYRRRTRTGCVPNSPRRDSWYSHNTYGGGGGNRFTSVPLKRTMTDLSMLSRSSVHRRWFHRHRNEEVAMSEWEQMVEEEQIKCLL